MKQVIFLLGLLAGYATACSQDRKLDQPLNVQSASMFIEADRYFAKTVLELTVINDQSVEIEAAQNFILDEGQVITGLELELNGRYREGSIEEKWKAANAYNSVVGKRVDPAIVQMTAKNRYRLNIYPIPPKSTRKLKLHIAQLLPFKEGRIWYQFKNPFGVCRDSLRVKIVIQAPECQARTENGLLKDSWFDIGQDIAGLNQVFMNASSDSLAFSFIPHERRPVVYQCDNKKDGSFLVRYFQGMPGGDLKHVEKLRVYWDASSSMRERNINLEFAFLKNYIRQFQPSEVLFTLFNDKLLFSIPFRSEVDDLESVFDFLRQFKPYGGTQLGNLDLSDPEGAPVLLFTDGYNSFGRKNPQTGRSVIHAICSNRDINETILNSLVQPTGGKTIRLTKDNLKEVVWQAGLVNELLHSVHDGKAGFVLRQPLFSRQSGDLFFYGQLQQMPVTEGEGHFPDNKRNAYDRVNCDSLNLKTIRMLLTYDSTMSANNWQHILRYGLTERVVTYRTSFIVLERVEDYIRYQIRPPKDLEETCREMNYVYNEAGRLQKLTSMGVEDKIAQLLPGMWQNANWWVDRLNRDLVRRAVDINQSAFVAAGQVIGMSNPALLPHVNAQTRELASVVVTAYGINRRIREMGYSAIRISRQELIQANPVSLAQGLTGKVSGLNIQTVNNGVFADTRITIRGIRSLTGNNQPMLILDNMPVDLRMINLINPNDVANVTVLKSPASTAIYGADGVNGAIVIQTRRGSKYSYNVEQLPLRLKDREDMDYITAMRSESNDMLISAMTEWERDHAHNPVFYFDMADLFFERGLKEQAMKILIQASEMVPDSYGQRSIAYILESWKEWDLAIQVYRNILEDNPWDMSIKRDLALAYYQQGKFQQALDTYYSLVMMSDESNQNLNLRQRALQEMNAILFAHPSSVSRSGIDQRLIYHTPVDLKIDVSGPGFMNVIEPGGDTCSYTKTETKSGGKMTYNGYWTQELKEFTAFQSMPGQYRILIDRYTTSRGRYHSPDLSRMIIFRKFQQPGQTLEIRNINLTYQWGLVELDPVDWNHPAR
ncbi:MAG: VIT domain-containing protein [Ferruginibacter sp.]